MSVTATLWQNINFGGFSSTSDTANYRYCWTRRRSSTTSIFHVDNGVLHGESAWSTVWVESGLVHQQVYDDLAPPLIDAAQDLTSAIEAAGAVRQPSV